MPDYLVGIINDEGRWNEVEYADDLEDGKERVARLVKEDKELHETKGVSRWQEVYVLNTDVGRRVYRHVIGEVWAVG
jgi:hypothetical protein